MAAVSRACTALLSALTLFAATAASAQQAPAAVDPIVARFREYRALAEAVEATLPQWRVEKDPRSAASCRIPASYYFMVRFVLQ